MNKVFLVGRLAADPEPFTTKSGINQARITIATQDNTNRQEAYFFPCIAWRNQANFINTYLKKGDLVAVDGKLTRRSFTSREGKTIYVTEVVVDAINSIGSKKDANSGLSVPNYAPKNNQPVKKTEATQSIDSSFPEQVVKQTEGHDIHQQEKPKHDKDADIDWLDELKEE